MFGKYMLQLHLIAINKYTDNYYYIDFKNRYFSKNNIFVRTVIFSFVVNLNPYTLMKQRNFLFKKPLIEWMKRME